MGALGLLGPDPDELLEAGWLVCGAVAGLGEVGGEVVELPAVLGEVAAADGKLLLIEDAGADVVRRRLPPVVVDRTRAEHLEVLRLVRFGRGRVSERTDRLRPSTGCWGMPSTMPGISRPTASMTVGARSMTWQNC